MTLVQKNRQMEPVRKPGASHLMKTIVQMIVQKVLRKLDVF